MKNYRLAKIAYDGYLSASGGKSLISGDKLPDFENLKQEIQDAWWAASEAVRVDVFERIRE